MQSPMVIKNPVERATIYLADNSPYRSSRQFPDEQKTIITGEFPAAPNEARIIETIRDPDNPDRLTFLSWENQEVQTHPYIESRGRIFVPPDATSSSYPLISVPAGLCPCGELPILHAQIASSISQFVKLSEEKLLIVVSVILASWFPDCFEAIPYLWVVGPLNSGKTTLLKLLWCFCRRGLIVGDLRGASLYKLTDTWSPTLIIDELETGSSRADGDLNRLLRTGSMPGTPAMRNGQPFATYGMKIIASRQPPSDAALLSRGLVVGMLPADDKLMPLDEGAMQRIEKEFQAKLLAFRLTNRAAVKNFSLPQQVFPGPSRRIQQIAHALAAPLLGDLQSTAQLFDILRTLDEDARAELFLEPEWLVVFPCSTCATRIWFAMVLGPADRKYTWANWPGI